MDLTDPTRSVSATLDGPVLAVLARSGKPLTAGQIAAQAARGSEIGIRRTLGRLVEQGIVRATEMGRNRVHELNRQHVAAPAAQMLADLRIELWKRMRQRLGTWNPKPLYACVFGSAARGDGDAHSDLDLLLVHPPFPGDTDPGRGMGGPSGAAPLTERQLIKWRRQVDELRSMVPAWTGNELQVLELSSYEWADHSRRGTELFQNVEREAVQIVGGPP
ncbi:MAG TPA: nucleotidyltransferase domain-containing protein [Streptosporangiaceae bacterium]|nr:nucleotidyltransferase domain-containing protein [Streptosporangiaceae bacterium]